MWDTHYLWDGQYRYGSVYGYWAVYRAVYGYRAVYRAVRVQIRYGYGYGMNYKGLLDSWPGWQRQLPHLPSTSLPQCTLPILLQLQLLLQQGEQCHVLL